MIRKILISVASVLLVANTVGIAWLVYHSHQAKTKADQDLPANVLAQLESVYTTLEDFRAELERVASEARYPNDESKNKAKAYVRGYLHDFEQMRLVYAEVDKYKSPDAIRIFASYGKNLTQVPTFTFQRYSGGRWRTFVNLSKLESLSEQYDILATNLLKETIKHVRATQQD